MTLRGPARTEDSGAGSSAWAPGPVGGRGLGSPPALPPPAGPVHHGTAGPPQDAESRRRPRGAEALPGSPLPSQGSSVQPERPVRPWARGDVCPASQRLLRRGAPDPWPAGLRGAAALRVNGLPPATVRSDAFDADPAPRTSSEERL
uniref:Uncharacterized protein n=1 Tax=Rousettus aegyptiacus TaxID=9407 RepID=A0A7J8JI79_ROUAE|nr:hypothetical protein HJG63_010408 [Rousettus aegyptiacus]